jgi:CheY-like chemotaxis protein
VSAASDGLGTGACFEVRLPTMAVASRIVAAEPKATPREPVSLAGLRVLGVDDEPEARDVLAGVVLAAGATVTMAGSVAAALEQLRIETPDVIVTDLAMPQIDGYGLVERVRTSSQAGVAGVPIVALTAHASAQDRAKCLASGFDAYASKPFDVIELCATIKMLAARGLDREE